jgi:hypothetical protein
MGFNKLKNLLIMLIGGASTILWVGRILSHRFVFFSSKGQKWVPSFVPVLLGVWLFVFGLIGFIHDKSSE